MDDDVINYERKGDNSDFLGVILGTLAYTDITYP